MHILMIVAFCLGYLAIILEYYIKINKTATSLVMAVVTWTILFLNPHVSLNESLLSLGEHVGNVSQIIFFLLGAMTLVELIYSHKGFKMITDYMNTRSRKKMLWLIGFFSFFLSAILDNITTTILMVSLLRKLIPDVNERLFLGSMVVIAANAGGAWTPIGDVTTTMLWINGQITTAPIMKALFFPSLCCLLVSMFLLGLRLKGNYPKLFERHKEQHIEPGAKLVFFCGVGALICVPLFKELTGLPPFMGMLIGLGILWLITDIMHQRHEHRKHLRVPHVLTRIDTSAVLFFLGILLSINALETVGILKSLAEFLGEHISHMSVIALVIGLISAVVDNVPLVAACMGMYNLEVYPVNSSLWQMIAYTAGTGGSILIIGSAAGVAMMGMEKIDFVWYMRKISLTAMAGYFAGMILYLLIQAL